MKSYLVFKSGGWGWNGRQTMSTSGYGRILPPSTSPTCKYSWNPNPTKDVIRVIQYLPTCKYGWNPNPTKDGIRVHPISSMLEFFESIWLYWGMLCTCKHMKYPILLPSKLRQLTTTTTTTTTDWNSIKYHCACPFVGSLFSFTWIHGSFIIGFNFIQSK